MKIVLPLPLELYLELETFWQNIFDAEPDLPRTLFLGEEIKHNKNVLFMDRQKDLVAGTCMITISKRVPFLGGFGEVATAPQFRRRGLASGLCSQAVEAFREEGGEALFLGTGNPEAARVYHRLGWRKLPGANVMTNIIDKNSPESFLVNHYLERDEITIRPANPEARIPIIPLLVTPHDWQVLDYNAQMYSTRYAIQQSCMGLYRKYDAITKNQNANWFVAYSGDGRAVGLSTARQDNIEGYQVDGFTHYRFGDAFEPLIKESVKWGADQGISPCWAIISVEDEEKRMLFEGMGFRPSKTSYSFNLEDRIIPAIRMDLI